MPTPFGLYWLLYLSAGVGLLTSIIQRKRYLLLNQAQKTDIHVAALIGSVDDISYILAESPEVTNTKGGSGRKP